MLLLPLATKLRSQETASSSKHLSGVESLSDTDSCFLIWVTALYKCKLFCKNVLQSLMLSFSVCVTDSWWEACDGMLEEGPEDRQPVYGPVSASAALHRDPQPLCVFLWAGKRRGMLYSFFIGLFIFLFSISYIQHPLNTLNMHLFLFLSCFMFNPHWPWTSHHTTYITRQNHNLHFFCPFDLFFCYKKKKKNMSESSTRSLVSSLCSSLKLGVFLNNLTRSPDNKILISSLMSLIIL